MRTVHEMTSAELLAQLENGNHWGPANAIHQIDLFVALGGDPDDHNYARLSFLTKELRDQGYQIGSSRQKGIWLEG